MKIDSKDEKEIEQISEWMDAKVEVISMLTSWHKMQWIEFFNG